MPTIKLLKSKNLFNLNRYTSVTLGDDEIQEHVTGLINNMYHGNIMKVKDYLDKYPTNFIAIKKSSSTTKRTAVECLVQHFNISTNSKNEIVDAAYLEAKGLLCLNKHNEPVIIIKSQKRTEPLDPNNATDVEWFNLNYSYLNLNRLTKQPKIIKSIERIKPDEFTKPVYEYIEENLLQ